MLPNGEFRVGKKGLSLLLRYKENFLSRLQSATPRKAEALRREGFTDYSLTVQIDNERGATRSETLSLDDFESFIFFAALEGKKEAIALQRALIRVGITDWFRLSFGLNQLTLGEKRTLFYKEYAKTIDWLKEDRNDIKLIKEQELFLIGKW